MWDFLKSGLYFLDTFMWDFCLCILVYDFGRKFVERTQAGGHETDFVH